MGDNYVSGLRREKVSVPIVESIGTIMRDPPRSVMTRKYEPVEMGDISYMIRENPDRHSDGIRQFSSHRNAMGGYTGSTQIYGDNTDNGLVDMSAGRKAIAVNRDGAFRIPGFTRDDTEALSRSRRPQPPATTNPGLQQNALIQDGFAPPHLIDHNMLRGSVQPNVYRDIATIQEQKVHLETPLHAMYNANPHLTIGGWQAPSTSGEHDQRHTHQITGMAHSASASAGGVGGEWMTTDPTTGIVIRPSISVSTSLGSIAQSVSVVNVNTQEVSQHIKDRPLISYLTPLFNVAVKNGGHGFTEIAMSTKDRINIAVTADASRPISLSTPDGKEIKLKNYVWSVVQANPSAPATLVLEDMNPQVTQHFRTLPHYQITAQASMRLQDAQQNVNLPTLDPKATVSVGALPSASIGIDRSFANTMLPDRMNVGGFANYGYQPTVRRDMDVSRESMGRGLARANLLRQAQRQRIE